MTPPSPMCECGHLYARHELGRRCRHQDDPDDDETRCRCPKFCVPRGRGRSAHRPGARTWSMAPSKRRGRWWR